MSFASSFTAYERVGHSGASRRSACRPPAASSQDRTEGHAGAVEGERPQGQVTAEGRAGADPPVPPPVPAPAPAPALVMSPAEAVSPPAPATLPLPAQILRRGLWLWVARRS